MPYSDFSVNCDDTLQVSQLMVQKSIQDEMVNWLNIVRVRLDENKTKCHEASTSSGWCYRVSGSGSSSSSSSNSVVFAIS